MIAAGMQYGLQEEESTLCWFMYMHVQKRHTDKSKYFSDSLYQLTKNT